MYKQRGRRPYNRKLRPNLPPRTHEQIGHFYVRMMQEQREEDRDAYVAYTHCSNRYEVSRIALQAAEIGSALGAAEGFVVDVELIAEEFLRWEFDCVATLMLFRMKFSGIIVSPPWRDFFSD